MYKLLIVTVMAMAVACGNDTTEFHGNSEVQPSTITVCQSVPNTGSYIIEVTDGEIGENAVHPANILGSY